ncbi:MAG: aminomethyl-transferring glycine dehydrogenase subunit GcvPA [Gammaproteobacteria bacterium]|nr:aminomethyl-transferring glycine dehydrogenase subunit GcvPA [Gammaproteobacteria bacterium]
MPFIPHTPAEVTTMLASVGVKNIETLFDEIPAVLRCGELNNIPAALTEQEVTRLMQAHAVADGLPICFLGAGAYEHHIPAAVWQITTRGEFYSAYTPYQPEASQGTLQLIYEYQSMMCSLTGLDVSNASLYDGGSALAEAVLMAVRANRKSQSRKILVPTTVNPLYRKATHAIVKNQQIELVDLPFNAQQGVVSTDTLKAHEGQDYAALVIQQPNFFGCLEDVDALTAWAHQQGMIVIAVCNPMTLAVLTPPGQWAQHGVDIACGDGQPLGIPLSSGGPYYGYLCCKLEHVRQMPGRIVGRTQDIEGREGFVLTLQAREQHIRRSKATSNICTNQGLMVTASTIFMSIMGPQGLQHAAAASHANTRYLAAELAKLKGIQQVFSASYFHEVVLRLNKPVKAVLAELAQHNIIGGYDLGADYPELENCLLLCVTETRSVADMQQYVALIQKLI